MLEQFQQQLVTVCGVDECGDIHPTIDGEGWISAQSQADRATDPGKTQESQTFITVAEAPQSPAPLGADTEPAPAKWRAHRSRAGIDLKKRPGLLDQHHDLRVRLRIEPQLRLVAHGVAGHSIAPRDPPGHDDDSTTARQRVPN